MRFLKNSDGAIGLMAAFILPILIGMAALAIEYGHGLVTKAERQRTADIAAYAGALAYNATNSEADIEAASDRIAALNGVAAADISARLGPSPRGNGNNAVIVDVRTTNRLFLAPAIGVDPDLGIAANAAAEVGGQAEGCILALDGGESGVTLSGGTSITATKCAVQSNSSISVPCGTSITTPAVTYNTSRPSVGCSGGLKPPAGKDKVQQTKTYTPDPLANHAGVATATARIATVAAIEAPVGPVVPPGTDIEFAWDQSKTKSQAAAAGCTAVWTQPVWKLTCPAGTRNFGALTIGGGISVEFTVNGAASNTYNFSGLVKSNAAGLSFGPGTYNLAKGLWVSGSASTSFGAGTFNIGVIPDSCGGGRFSVCVDGSTSLSIAGPSRFSVSSGISVAGSSSLTFGSGSGNSIAIGPSSNGYAVYAGGGAKTRLADATLFRLKGNVYAGGGSCTYISAAAQHDVSGNISLSGGAYLGSGVYTVDGYFALGENGGGNVACKDINDASYTGVVGTSVTIVVSGKNNAGGSCSGQVFCLAAGYSNVALTSPTSGPTAKLAVIGPTSDSVTGGASFTAGASGTSLSGALYFPKGPISLSGGASLGGGSGQCLQMVGSRVTLSGGTSAASTCVSSSGGGGAGRPVLLVQ